MSVPFYYQDGVVASTTMKRDLHRVRNRPGLGKRYGSKRKFEERVSSDGKKSTVEVWTQPMSMAMTGRERHDLWTARRKREW